MSRSAQEQISGFVTGAATAPAATALGTRSAARTAETQHEIFFELQIREEIPKDPFDEPQAVDLLPGQSYHLRLTTTENGNENQRSFRIRGDIMLAVLCTGLPAPAIRIAGARLTVARADLDTLNHEVQFTVADRCPRGDVTFDLLFIEHGKSQKFTAAQLSRFVAGNENPVDQKLLECVKVQLNADPPEQLAILHIEAPSSGKYRMRGWNRRVDNLAIELPRPDEKIGLADFVEGAVSPADVLGIIKGVSRRASQQLLKWFQDLYRKHGEQLCLIIADHTDADVPWEMLEFEPHKNLGASCAVARWIPVQNFEAWTELAVTSQEWRGGVVAHLDYQELKHTSLEEQVLADLNADFRDNSQNLWLRLSQSLADIGLVYLACHGIFTYNKKHEAAVGSLQNPSQRISAVQLEDLERLSGPRPMFFVNACHSARLMRDSYGFYGLPEVLLALLASGYIGTLGPVGMEYAPVIGQQILERALNSKDGIRPAEELRRIRAEAVERVKKQQSPENLLNLVFVFMYVYYGNPLATLRLKDGG